MPLTQCHSSHWHTSLPATVPHSSLFLFFPPWDRFKEKMKTRCSRLNDWPAGTWKKGLMWSNVGNYFLNTKKSFKMILGYCRIDHRMRHSDFWFQLSLISHCVFLVVAGCFILKQQVPAWSDLLSWKPVINRLVPYSLRITDPLLGPTQRLPWCCWWKHRHVAGRPWISPDRRSELSHKWNKYKLFYNYKQMKSIQYRVVIWAWCLILFKEK